MEYSRPTVLQQFFSLPLRLLFAVILLGHFASCKYDSEKSSTNAANYDKVLDSANFLYDAGQQARSIAYLNSSVKNLQNLTYKQKSENYRLHYNYYFHVKQNNTMALYYAEKLLALAKTAPNQEERTLTYSMAMFFKGDVLFRENRYNEAYFSFYQGKITTAQSGKTKDCVLSDYSYHMGMILYKQEHYRMAAQYFKDSFNETGSCKTSFSNFYRQQELLNNTGLCYNKIEELDSALIYFDKALVLINNPPGQYHVPDSLLNAARGVVYGNQASVYTKKQYINKAKALLKKSITINVQKGYDNNDGLLSELKLARLHERLSQIDSMLPLLKGVEEKFRDIKNESALADWNHLMADYYRQKKQFPKALDHYIKYDSVKSMVMNNADALKATDITEQLKRFEKDYEVNQLKRTNEQKSIYLVIAGVFFVMLLIILSLIYFNWQKSKKLLNALGDLNKQVHEKNIDLEKALEKLEYSSQEKDRILRTVAHDLRNPIGGIASLTGSVIDDDDCSAEQKNYLHLIKNTAFNSLELINEILEATNITNENLVKDWVEINELLNNSVELLRFKAAEKNQQIIFKPLSQPEKLFISREKIWRVVSNLISNAIKFSTVGGTIIVEAVTNGDCVEISVNDNGIGIPEAMQHTVFNMFTEAKRPGTLGEKSFGLGLSICKQILALHQGDIWFNSNHETGTTFYVRLFI